MAYKKVPQEIQPIFEKMIGPRNEILVLYPRQDGINSDDYIGQTAKEPGWRWHCEDGPALQFDKDEVNALAYPDEQYANLRRQKDLQLWYWKDTLIPYTIDEDKTWILTNPEKLNVDIIMQENNLEIRRVMLEKYGLQRFMKEANPEVLDEDIDPSGMPRRLLRIQLEREEPIVMVDCFNSSPEPDGTFKKYLLHCHPELKPLARLPETRPATAEELRAAREWTEKQAPQKMTCHNAVASTFGRRGEEYGLPGQTRQGDTLTEMKTGVSAQLAFRES